MLALTGISNPMCMQYFEMQFDTHAAKEICKSFKRVNVVVHLSIRPSDSLTIFVFVKEYVRF